MMRKLIVFNHVSLDGYFTGDNGDFSWAHSGNDEPNTPPSLQETPVEGRVGVWQDHLRPHGKLLADSDGESQRSEGC
jgi:hypothetical protein